MDTMEMAIETRNLEATKTAKPGVFRVRLIDSGQGSSGFYPKEVLEAAAKDKVFKAGTHMHLDHPTLTEMMEMPVRSVKDWVGVLAEDAQYNPKTTALEAKVKIFAPYKDLISSMAEDVGLSIRAYAEGDYSKEGITFTKLTEAIGVDFVTHAGRGGKVLEILESARQIVSKEATANDRRDQLERALQAEVDDDEWWAYVIDFDEEGKVVYYRADSKTWKRSYSVAADDNAVTFEGEPEEVRQVVTFIPVSDEETLVESKELNMSEDTRSPELVAAEAMVGDLSTQVSTLTATLSEKDAAIESLNTQVSELTASLEETKTALEAANAVIAQAKAEALEADNQAKAAAVKESLLSQSTLPAPAKDRVVTGLTIPVDENGAFDEARFTEALEAAIKVETDYIAAISPAPSVTGFGETEPVAESKKPVSVTTPWGRAIELMEV